MKISNREKIMLYILGIILIGLGYYNFIYSVQVTKIEASLKEESEIKQKYTSAMETINSIEDRKSYVKILKAKIGEESKPFYPTINEEKIIIEVDKLLKDSGLKGGIIFKPIVLDSVENSKREQIILGESSLQGIADKYNNVNNDEKSQTSSDKTSNNKNDGAKTQNSNNTNGNTSDASSSKSNDGKEKKNKVQYVKFQVKFEGTYEALDKFLDKISNNERKIVVNSITIKEDTLNSLKGTIDLEIYAISKITDELESYLKWDINNTYGKTVPFTKGAASGITNKSKDTSDFIAAVKSTNSELPSIILGKTNDSLKTSYVYADSNSEETVEMILTKVGNKYYCKYKTKNGSFPTKYEGLGAEFVPVSKNIVIDIFSEARASSEDKSNIKLKIVNKTDKLAEVNISGDDTANPRVKIDGDGTDITINQK